MRKFLGVFFAFLTVSPVFAGDIVLNTWGGLNSQDSPATLQPYQAQDLINVWLQPRMSGVYKRDGYGLFQNLPISCSTCAVHGGYHFQQTGGNDVQLWGNDTELSGSVNDANFVKLATGTVAATWQCTDNLGFAYCVTSANDSPIKTDGSVANTTYQPVNIPLGTMITSTPLQLVVAGVSGSPSTLNFSANNNFLNFVTGPLTTDPYTEIINAPGSRITHIAYYFGKVFWWKDQSFGYLSNTGSQYTPSLTIVSNQIGTLDNSSTFWNASTFETANAFTSGAGPNAYGTTTQQFNNPQLQLGGIFFRGQDNHIYQYDGYTLTRLTRIITPTITSANRRKANQWTQTTQADFQGGVSTPAANISLTISPGDVTVSSFTKSENSSTTWTNGFTNNTNVFPSSITLATNNSGNITNPSFESAFSGNWTDSGSQFSKVASQSGSCTISPQSGSFFALYTQSGSSVFSTFRMETIDLNNNVLDTTNTGTLGSNCAWSQMTLTPSSQNIGKRVKFRIHMAYGGALDEYLTTSDSYILGGNVTWYSTASHDIGNLTQYGGIDNIQNGSSTITSGSFTSQSYNTGIASMTYQLTQITYTANTSTPTFDIQTANNVSGPWFELTTATGTNNIGNGFVRFTSTITIGSGDSALTALSSWTILGRSTGTYYSAVNNAPSLTSWGSFLVDDQQPGNSSITYYVRAATGAFAVGSSTVAWVQQTKNSTVNYSTGTYFQMRADFALTAATETPTMNDFTFNWFEGTALDKAYMTYFNDHIWIAESSGTSVSTDDVIYRLDLLNNAWLQDTIAANGFLVENNNLYFGDPIQGRVFKFGGVTTDNGNGIHAYWKSKDFTGDNPTTQNEYMQSDFIFNVAATTVTYTYQVDQTGSTSVTIPLTSSLGSSLIKRGFLLGKGKIGTFYNFKIDDSSSNPAWKLMFHHLNYNPLNWRPQTS